jgi:hypothetical protein
MSPRTGARIGETIQGNCKIARFALRQRLGCGCNQVRQFGARTRRGPDGRASGRSV